MATLRLSRRGITALSFVPSGEALIINIAYSTLRLWMLASGCLQPEVIVQEEDPYANLYPPLAAVLSPTGSTLATGRTYIGWEKGCMTPFSSVRLWDTTSGRLRAVMPQSPPGGALAFSPDGEVLAIGGGLYCDVASFGQLWCPATSKLRTIACPSLVLTLAFSPDGGLLACGGALAGGERWAGETLLSDVQTGQSRASLRGQEGMVTAVAFAPVGRTLATGGDDGTVKLWR
jgi:WD40 repeat protein